MREEHDVSRSVRRAIVACALAAALSPACYIGFCILASFSGLPVIIIAVAPKAWSLFFPFVLVPAVTVLPFAYYLHAKGLMTSRGAYAWFCGSFGPISVVTALLLQPFLGPPNPPPQRPEAGLWILQARLSGCLVVASFVRAFVTALCYAGLLDRLRSRTGTARPRRAS